MDEPGAYDLIAAFDVIHDQAQPRVVLKNVARGSEARRNLPDGGHQGVEPRSREPRSPDGAVSLLDLHACTA